jgi:hypothetical protein
MEQRTSMSITSRAVQFQGSTSGPTVEIGVAHSIESADKPSVDDYQLNVTLPDLLDAWILSMAQGESGALDASETRVVAYDAMISYLEHMKQVTAEKKRLYVMAQVANEG